MPLPVQTVVLAAKGVIVGQVLSIEPHPKADKLLIAKVIYRNDRPPSKIIFGGITEVVKVGSLVPVAPASKICRVEGKKMRRQKFRGVYSHGELCSLYELGLVDNDTNQVAVFRPELKLNINTPLEDILQNIKTIDDLSLVFEDSL